MYFEIFALTYLHLPRFCCCFPLSPKFANSSRKPSFQLNLYQTNNFVCKIIQKILLYDFFNFFFICMFIFTVNQSSIHFYLSFIGLFHGDWITVVHLDLA